MKPCSCFNLHGKIDLLDLHDILFGFKCVLGVSGFHPNRLKHVASVSSSRFAYSRICDDELSLNRVIHLGMSAWSSLFSTESESFASFF